ncbi:MAG: hypothetical protein ACYC63_04785 [Armatimonadota bacterium]
MADLTLSSMPFIPATISLPSDTLKVAGIGGVQPLMYKFRKGHTTNVADETDVRMLLALKRKVQGPGGIGSMEIGLLQMAGAVEAPQSLDDKFTQMLEQQDRLLALLAKAGIQLEDEVMETPDAPEIVEAKVVADAVAEVAVPTPKPKIKVAAKIAPVVGVEIPASDAGAEAPAGTQDSL